MQATDKGRYFMFSKEDVLRLLQYRIEYHDMFRGKRGTAMQGWKLVARRLANGSNERHVAKKFSNLINMYNRYIASVKKNPEYEINWPFFHVMKEVIRMLNSLKTNGTYVDYEHFEEDGLFADVDDDDDDDDNDDDADDDQVAAEEDQEQDQDLVQSTNDNDDKLNVAIKQEVEDDDSFEDDAEAENDISGGAFFHQKTWHRDLVLKLIHLRGVKYASYFGSKDKSTNNHGWMKIHSDPDFKSMEEKQLRKKWQNMVHRYKCINESIKQGQQTESDISWQFYEPIGKVLNQRNNNQARYSPRGPISRRSTDINEPSTTTPNETTSLASSPTHNDDVAENLLEPVVTIKMGNQLLKQTSQRVTRGAYVKGQYAKLENFGDESDSLEDAKPNKRQKVNTSREKISNDDGGQKNQSVMEYERKRDKILFAQNNNMLKMMKAWMEKQGVRIPYDVCVDFSDI